MKKTALTILLTFLCQLTGCQKPGVVNNPVTYNTDSDTIWLACKNELWDRGFSIEFQNRTMGVIETKPLTSRQWFEFWKKDVVDGRSLFKASTQTTCRVVTINIVDKPTEKSLLCSVAISQQYTKTVTSSPSVRAEDNFTATAHTLEKETNPAEKTWQPAGTDKALEQAILRSIQLRIKQ